MYRVIYIGNEPIMISFLHQVHDIEVMAVISQKSKCNSQNSSLLASVKNTYSIDRPDELLEILEQFRTTIDFAIMYSFGIILPPEAVNSVRVFNFHPGSVSDNRGSSPINWTILLNRKNSTMTLHEISEEIDAGKLVCEHDVHVYENDVPSTLKTRMEGEIPSMLLTLLDSIKNRVEFAPLPKGTYRQRITVADYQINPEDSEETIKAKIRSQYDYQGAPITVNGETVYIRDYRQYLQLKQKLDRATLR